MNDKMADQIMLEADEAVKESLKEWICDSPNAIRMLKELIDEYEKLISNSKSK